MIPLNQDCSSLVAEVNTLRQELGILVTEVRDFAVGLQSGGYDSQLSGEEIGEILEEIVNGN